MSQHRMSDVPAIDNTSPILYGAFAPELIRQETLADLLEATALAHPDKTALIFADVALSYRVLNERADLVASHLIAAGVRPGHILGLWLPRGIDLLVMQAGIAKAGAAWLPFDADVPVDRIAVCLDDAQAFGILTADALASQLRSTTSTTSTAHQLSPACHIWTAMQLMTAIDAPLLRRQATAPTDPAYVIYTSGSTGKPKGIAITQGSICHFLRSENQVLGITSVDKVYQGFSVAFDMSFEEIWISYLVGATLWIAPKEIAVDPDALPMALIANQVTVLHAVPTLLALFNEDVPSLRLINLGGEMCPESLVTKWSKPGRQMFNTYGPTEATVSASLAVLQPDMPVTIGHPLPNYGLLVIDADVEKGLRLLARGETGELCIFGPGVSDGYLGRPDLTAEKFIANPWSAPSNSLNDQRLYRTGDLARIAEDGSVQCLGRADDQVKIRGFRVELGEIEAVLAQQAGVGTVAVILRSEQGVDQLIAFIVNDSSHVIKPSDLRQALLASLPSYMVPSRYEFLSEMPRLTSGKIDRKTLKAQTLSETVSTEESDLPETPAEEILFAALNKLLPGQAIHRSADFFSDLGGHSLLAARLVSMLRADARYAYFKISDIYQSRLVGTIAGVMTAGAITSENIHTTWEQPSDVKRWICGAAQAVMIPFLVAMRMMQWLAPFFAYHFFTGDPDDSIIRATFLSVGVFLLLTLFEFVIAIAGKWLIVGRLKAGNYPLWGVTYYRWWLADRLVEAAPTYMLSGSSMYAWWLRALGAKIGKDVNIGSITLRSPDLLQIGDGASIGNACNFENARVERGLLRLGKITLGNEAYVGSYSVLEGGTELGNFAHLEGQSALSEGQSIPNDRIWRGSPAADVGVFDPASRPERPVVSELRFFTEAVFFIFGSLLITALFFLPVFPSFITIDWFDNLDSLPWLQSNNMFFQLTKYFILAFPATAILIVCTALLSAGIRWSILPKLKAGTYQVHGNTYCGKWLVNQIQESSLNVLHGVYATVYAPYWYRLLGAKVGRGAEISTALGVVPDMLTLGDDTFIADAVLLGDEEIDGGWMSMQPTVISRRSFVGNGAYIPDGTILPENVLIGVHTSAPRNDQMHEGDTWLGSPPMHLPAREEVKGFPEELTFRPSAMRRLGRGLIEAFRIISPHAMVISVGYTIVLNLMPLAGDDRWGDVAYYLSIAGLWYGVGSFAFVMALKWLFIFRYKKSSMPMWTSFVWLSEGITNLYEGIAVPNFMRYLRGTPWLPLAFNLLGARIGRGVYLDTTDITEFDCVSIGAYSEINALACPQTHLFEDRVMKIDEVIIGERVYMGARSSVLYSAVVGDEAKLGALTLVMKGEFIPAKSSWRGCPAAIAQS
ncbi:amino acid adenylation domain-containing protein [Undibacterium sp. RTI2.1]|uniref:Pls/PosA family non-ribosomal peptide synthetase n=2 Tax=Undibacterium TaxID=401469 RepID=UPI002B22A1AA|nr:MULTISPECIES: Pls/PosA family non-ribosomal peptide synthetase [unclassified Undibacterium]MEB0032825.1 amino acid adenylation domain-containing protein [Undibacterium sp. RTI2.1]MEB0232766.1 amino acid adenylation domain-containing protein [Undibacterium sp. 10I3]